MSKQTRNSMRQARGCARLAMIGGLLLSAAAARADELRIENVAVAPRDEKSATVTFDVSWSNSWRHGTFHDAAWVFFKVRARGKPEWQHARLIADKVVNPAGYGQKEGTPLEFVVPDGEEGFLGMFVRRAGEGKGAVAAAKVTAVWDFAAAAGVKKDVKAEVRAFGVEMAYVAEGPYFLGCGGTKLNRFFTWADDGKIQAYLVTSAGAVPTGRQNGKLWAMGITPPDGGEIPASFPNGYAAFYCMKRPYLTQGQYAGFLNTLTAEQAKVRYYTDYQGVAIKRSGNAPDYTCSPSALDSRCPWLSWGDFAAWAAWAGLRPMTEMEFEKAIRGQAYPTPGDASLSYWGITDVNTGAIYERPVSAGSAAGYKFAGTHGRGTPQLPADWPKDVGRSVFRGDYTTLLHYQLTGHLCTSGRLNALNVNSDRSDHAFAGWRGVRSAPSDAALGPITGRVAPGSVRPIARLGRPFRADGVPDEWGKPALSLSGPADLFPVQNRFAPFDFYGCLLKPWQGPEDMGAKVYLGWDGEALCVAAEVTDDRHFNTKSGKDLLNGDALQMGLTTPKGVTWNVGLALTKKSVVFHQWEGNGDTLLKTVGCAVVRDDKARITRYGLRLPLAALGLETGEEFRFNIVFYDDDDGTGIRHWLQLAPGMAPGLPRAGESASVSMISGNTALYPRFVLEK